MISMTQKHWHNEAGSVLVVGMLTLVLMTLIGFAATTTGTLESEMSGNEKTYQQAFYASELGLVTGETILEGLLNRVDLNEGSTPGRYPSGSLTYDHATYQLLRGKDGMGVVVPQAPVLWDNTDSTALANVPAGLNSVKTAPRYILEERRFQRHSQRTGTMYGNSGVYYFNVTARGTGSSSTARVLLGTVYAKQF